MSSTLVVLAQQDSPVLPAIVTASATVLGVVVTLLVSHVARRSDEAVRRREQLADALGAGLGYLSDLDVELSRALRSGSNYWTQAGWHRAVTDWPATRRQMLTQAMAYPDEQVRAAITATIVRLTALVQEQGRPASELRHDLEALRVELLAMNPAGGRRRLFEHGRLSGHQ